MKHVLGALVLLITTSVNAFATYQGSPHALYPNFVEKSLVSIHGSVGSTYANSCPQASQNWCVGSDGFTVFTPVVPTTGLCGATGSANGTCVTYIAENGTGTSATCRVAATVLFSFTNTVPDSQACPYTPASISLARNASSDFLLFKRGDCFMDPGQISPCTGLAAPSTNAPGICAASNFPCNFSNRSGLSAAAPLVISSYGSLTLNRPRISTLNYGFSAQAGAGNNIAIVSLWFDGGWLFSDYNNSTYNPGFIAAASSSAVGTNTITLASAPSSSIVNNTNSGGWSIANFSNQTSLIGASGTAGLRVASISGATVTLLSNIPTGFAVATNDRMVFIPANNSPGGIFNLGTPLQWAYVEDCLFEGTGMGLQSTTPNAISYYIRRNVVHDASFVITRNQGIFLSDSFNTSSTVLTEENLFDHAGWRQLDPDCTAGQFLPSKCNGVASLQMENFYGNPNSQAQNSYDHENCCLLTYQRNISTNASGTGVQVRSGGILYNNFLARNAGGSTGGGIAWPNTVSYNVFSDITNSYGAILKVASVAGNVLTFTTGVPLSLGTSSQSVIPFDASNPSAMNQTTNTLGTLVPTTSTNPGSITINGPAISVAVGDTIYFNAGPAFGYAFNSSWTNPATVSQNSANPSNVQWNVSTNALSQTFVGGANQIGWNYLALDNRASGNVFANNFMMNNQSIGSGQGGMVDQSEIQSIDGNASCGGQVRIGVFRNTLSNTWHVGDAITITGAQPSSMNANVSTTVASVDATPPNFLCLSGTTFGTGTWTSGTGLLNGGVAWGPNYYYNVAQPLYVTPSGYTQPSLQSFTPVVTSGCPQAIGCPSIEGYDLSIGGDGTLSHFLDGAKANHKGAWDSRYTAPAVNHYIRAGTSATMPNPSF